MLDVRNLKMWFPQQQKNFLNPFGKNRNYLKALDGVSLNIAPGQTVGLVGESGCGKSTLGKCIVRLLQPTSGEILFENQDLAQISMRQMRPFRRKIQMVFQDPAESLNPRLSVSEIIAEPLIIHKILPKSKLNARILELLNRVGLPASAATKFPFEFSGGQRQRIGIARALALNPSLIILDEPVSALDVSVQSQILNLLLELQKEFFLSYLFIAHDLSVVRHISDNISVMYLGKIVESAPTDELFSRPLHAYTKALLNSIPIPDPTRQSTPTPIPGELPSPLNPPQGSAFGHRISHPNYEASIGLDLTPREFFPGHFVAPDPCCLEEEILNSKLH